VVKVFHGGTGTPASGAGAPFENLIRRFRMYASDGIISTSGPDPVILIAMPGGGATYNRLTITNTGANDGFFSVDGGNKWGYIPGTPADAMVIPVVWRGIRSAQNVLIKRNTADMSGVSGFADSRE
jgi:hypothetical protein